jgi:predicted DNA-binding protein
MADFKHISEIIEEVLKETEDFFYEVQKQRETENGANKQ